MMIGNDYRTAIGLLSCPYARLYHDVAMTEYRRCHTICSWADKDDQTYRQKYHIPRHSLQHLYKKSTRDDTAAIP